VRVGEINGTGALEVEQSGKDASQRSADRISPIPVRGSMITAALFAGVGSFLGAPATRAHVGGGQDKPESGNGLVSDLDPR